MDCIPNLSPAYSLNDRTERFSGSAAYCAGADYRPFIGIAGLSCPCSGIIKDEQQPQEILIFLGVFFLMVILRATLTNHSTSPSLLADTVGNFYVYMITVLFDRIYIKV